KKSQSVCISASKPAPFDPYREGGTYVNRNCPAPLSIAQNLRIVARYYDAHQLEHVLIIYPDRPLANVILQIQAHQFTIGVVDPDLLFTDQLHGHAHGNALLRDDHAKLGWGLRALERSSLPGAIGG